VTRWQEATADHYRQLEGQQRALAETAGNEATRDIHLEFADRYRQQAEQLEKDEQRRPAAGSDADQD
jgi:hypothetical protein